MIWYQIVLLILGIIIFVLSFIIPEKAGEKFDRKETKREVEKLLDEEVKSAVNRLETQLDEKIEDSLERTTRSLERISNDKIMAVNEYSDTVLTDIHKNHEEVMFLYSMLDDKHNQLVDTVAGMEQTTKNVQSSLNEMVMLRDSTDELLRTQYEQIQNVQTMQPAQINYDETEKELTEAPMEPEEHTIEELVQALEEFSQEPAKKEKVSSKKSSDTKRTRVKKGAKELPEIQSRDTKGNRNEAVLKLHADGKSNVAIAKELGLGVGEVKLIIDLFRQS